jgi:hypothetical protein
MRLRRPKQQPQPPHEMSLRLRQSATTLLVNITPANQMHSKLQCPGTDELAMGGAYVSTTGRRTHYRQRVPGVWYKNGTIFIPTYLLHPDADRLIAGLGTPGARHCNGAATRGKPLRWPLYWARTRGQCETRRLGLHLERDGWW